MRKILVQNCETKLFLREGENWTHDAGEARNFGTSLNAVAFCLQTHVNNAQVVVRFDTPGSNDVIVPIQVDEQAFAEQLR